MLQLISRRNLIEDTILHGESVIACRRQNLLDRKEVCINIARASRPNESHGKILSQGDEIKDIPYKM